MEQMDLTANDYNQLANQITNLIDLVYPVNQQYDIELHQNNKCFFMTIDFITPNEIICTNIQTYNMDLNTEILSNFDAAKLDKCLIYDVCKQ